MAEIHVQTKKNTAASSMWIWIVLALVIVGAVIYYLMTRNKATENNAPPANTTGAIKRANNPFDINTILEQQNAVLYTC
jgi:hypothetical protein